MAYITPYKIATRTWAHDTMGSAAKFSYSTGNDCLTISDINQDTSARSIITPSSTTSGAIPSSYLSNSNKCIKQSDLDDMYENHYVNIDAKLTYNNALTISKYNLTIRVYYKNTTVSLGSAFPTTTGILKNINVDIVISCYDKLESRLVAETITGCSLSPNHTNINEIGMNCLNINNGVPLIGGTITGSIDNDVFAANYLNDMYNYYNGGTSTYTYDITSSITPEYGVEYNSIYQAQKYILLPPNVITTTSTSSITADLNYGCTSNSEASLVPGVSVTWGYKIILSNISPTTSTTPASSITLKVDKGTIIRNNSWNSTSNTLTITGSVTYTPTSELETVPFVSFIYRKNGYTPLSAVFPVNLKNEIVS